MRILALAALLLPLLATSPTLASGPACAANASLQATTIVRKESVTISALAEALMMDKGQLSRTVRELEQLGLVHRTPDPEDGRSSLLSPTDEGLQRLASARRPYENSLVTTLADWPVDEIDHLARLLNALSTGSTP